MSPFSIALAFFSKPQLIAIGAVIGAAGVGVAAYNLHDWRVDSLRTAWEEEAKELAAAAVAASQKDCDENNQITKEQSHALQSRYDAINARYLSVLKHATTGGNCAVTIADAASGDDAAAYGAMPAMLLPIDKVRAADKQAADLITAQDTIAAIYRKNGQADLLPDEYR